MSDTDKMIITVAVLGGTGKEGSGLALRWANAGYRVVIGSRSAEKATTAAGELNALLGGDLISGATNEDAAAQANLVVLTVPYDAHKGTLESVREQLQGKILVDVTVPLKPPKIRQVNIPEGLSAALEAQQFLGDGVQVVAAFQNVSASHLKDLDHQVDCDVLICSDSEDAKSHAIQLAEAAGMRGVDAGPLVNAIAVEAFTPVMMYINKKHGIKGSGIRITGIA